LKKLGALFTVDSVLNALELNLLIYSCEKVQSSFDKREGNELA
jgi:hypothetical protein